MARRRKNEGLIDVLLVLPWWVSIAVGSIGFVVLRWIVPSILGANPMLRALVPLSHSFAWMSFIGAGGVAAIAFAKSRLQGDRATGKFSAAAGRSVARTAIDTAPSHGYGAWTASNDDAKRDLVIEQFDVWSIDALRAIEWKRFELLCAKYYEAVGFKSETIRCGADGGIDVKLFRTNPTKPFAVVQCKAWNTNQVGVKEVRELLGVMAHEKVARGVFITTSSYTKEALAFGAVNPIQLLNGDAFLMKLQELPEDRRSALRAFAFEGDYKTPTCPSCGIKMTKRDSRRGEFWGCLHYPRCKRTFPIKN